MKKLGKTGLIVITLVIAVSLIGVTYAFFNYYKEGGNQKLIAGQVYLKLIDGTDTLMMTNMFPETKIEARDETRTDNVITFTVGGKNTSDTKNVRYDILIAPGDSVDGRIRLKAKDLRFDLIEVNGETEVYLQDAASFDSINDTLLYSQIINANTTTQTTKTYKLRMWIDESVIISDTYDEADYSTQVYKNSFASVKVAVSGEMVPVSN